MAQTTAPTPTKEGRPERAIGVPFQKGHHRGRPKGSIDRRRIAGQMAAKAIESRAWDVVYALLEARAWRPRFEAARLVLAYSIGMPRQSLTIEGGLGDLSRELAAALQEARARRAALDASVSVTPLSATPPALPALPAAEAPALEGEVMKTKGEGEP